MSFVRGGHNLLPQPRVTVDPLLAKRGGTQFVMATPALYHVRATGGTAAAVAGEFIACCRRRRRRRGKQGQEQDQGQWPAGTSAAGEDHQERRRSAIRWI